MCSYDLEIACSNILEGMLWGKFPAFYFLVSQEYCYINIYILQKCFLVCKYFTIEPGKCVFPGNCSSKKLLFLKFGGWLGLFTGISLLGFSVMVFDKLNALATSSQQNHIKIVPTNLKCYFKSFWTHFLHYWFFIYICISFFDTKIKGFNAWNAYGLLWLIMK